MASSCIDTPPLILKILATNDKGTKMGASQILAKKLFVGLRLDINLEVSDSDMCARAAMHYRHFKLKVRTSKISRM